VTVEVNAGEFSNKPNPVFCRGDEMRKRPSVPNMYETLPGENVNPLINYSGEQLVEILF
jgi:hypothetical protein